MLIASFTATQSDLGADLVIRDTTDYSQEPKSAMSSRIIRMSRSDGSLYPNDLPIPFAYADYPTDVITIPNFDRDYAFNITLEITPATVIAGSIYTRTRTKIFQNHIYQFLFAINQELAANPQLRNKPNFISSMMSVIVHLNCAINAGTLGRITSAQFALDQANKIIRSKNIYF